MSAKTLAAFFPMHNLLGISSVEGMAPDAWRTPVRAGVNHPVWILSHVNRVRRSIARNLGAPLPEEPADSPELDAACLPADHYPAPGALVEEFRTLGETIATRLAAAPDSVLRGAFSPDFPDGRRRTVGEAIQFLIAHEALHVGQLTLLRRLHGMPGVAKIVMEKMSAGTAHL